MDLFKPKFHFAKAVKEAHDIEALAHLASRADEECVLTDEANIRIGLLIAAAKPHIGTDVDKLKSVALNFATYAGRLKAVESFMADGITGVQAAHDLIELIRHGVDCVCEECNPNGLKLVKKIVSEVIVKFQPTAETSAADLALTGKVLQNVDMNKNGEAWVIDGEIAEFAKRFTAIAELLSIAQSLSVYLNINSVLMHLLANNEAIDSETALAILKTTKSRSKGGSAVINKLLRQLAKSTGEDFDLCELLGQSGAFRSGTGIMPMVLPNDLGKLLSSGFSGSLFEGIFGK